jgi:hypothetical protein
MIAYHHKSTRFGNMFGTCYLEKGIDKWLLEGMIESEADQWFAGSGHGIDVAVD